MRAVRGALPVVEEEEHRRTVRHRAKQVPEFPECVRANDVAIVLGEIQACLPFAGEHAEVILPEVDHNLVELPFARDGARELRGLDLADHLLIALRGLCQLRIPGEHLLPRLGPGHHRIVRARGLGLALQSLQVLELTHDVAGRRREDGVVPYDIVAGGIGNALGVELKVDPLVDAHGAHLRRIAWSRPERKSVEHLLDLLIGEQLALHGDRGCSCRRWPAGRGFGRGGFSRRLTACRRGAESQGGQDGRENDKVAHG
jgi:hypothetical protein